MRREVIRLPYKESDTGSSPVPGTNLLAHSSRSFGGPNPGVEGAIPEGPAI